MTLTIAIEPRTTDRFEQRGNDWTITPIDEPLGFLFGSLPFPLETLGLWTQFRSNVLNYIYHSALALSGNQLESAAIAVSDTSDEEDSLRLDLTLIVRSDWDGIRELRRGILAKVAEESRVWSEEEKKDYGRRVYFGLVPSAL